MQHRLIPLLPLLATCTAFAARPNVVIVITDDQGYGDLACHGNPVVQTPAMDALHAESVRLTDYHVSPTCAPTRGALMSGHYTNRAGPWHTIMGRSFLRPESTTLGEVFSAGGYRTGLFGKWHLGDNYPYRPTDRGFQEVVSHAAGGVGQTPDHWDNAYFGDTYMHNGKPQQYAGYCTDVFFSEAKRFIKESVEQGEPFLAYISTNAPHSPFHGMEKYWQPYIGRVSTPEEAVFYGMIANIDENLAALRAHLADLGVADDTILIFTTDNGTATGQDIHNAGMRGKKGSEYDGGHRVPFFLRWPAGGLDQGRDIEELTAHIDVLPTLIELCGLQAPMDYSFDGRPLTPLLYRNPLPWPDRTIITDSQRVKDPVKWKSSATMTSRWRLINGTELYDIKADPGQQNDVAAQHPDVVAKLRQDYEAWWASVSTLFDKETRIVLGNDAENPVQLTCHDWITDDEVTPWHQAYVREAKPGTGFWALHVERPGRYTVALRRWPVEVALPLTSGMPAGAPVPGLRAFRESPGKAIPVRSATLRIADTILEQPYIAGSESVTFTVDLPAGDINLQGDFRYGDGAADVVGSYYAVVTRLEGKPDPAREAARYAALNGFSWERVPTCLHFGKRTSDMTDEEIEFVAAHTNFVVLEKSHGARIHGSTEKGTIDTARRLKARNPDIKVFFYLNAFINWPNYDALADFKPEWLLRGLDGQVVTHPSGTPRPDLSNPDMRAWWAGAVARTLAEGDLDGVFADALPQVLANFTGVAVGPEKHAALIAGAKEMLALTKAKIGSKVILVNGTRGEQREILDWPAVDGFMIEHFDILGSTSLDDRLADMETIRMAPAHGKFVVLKGWPGFTWLDKEMMALPHKELLARTRAAITFPLAVYLVCANPGDAFCYSWGYTHDDGMLDSYPEFDKPLGKPLGDAAVNGYRWSRAFEHCSVSVDVATREASITWK